MAPLNLLEMLNTAIGTPHKEAVDFKALRELLEAIIGQLDQQELAVLEPGQSATPGLGKEQDTTAQPGREKEEDGALGTGQQPQEPQEQLERKDSLEGSGSSSEVTSMAKEVMPKITEEKERDVSKDKASIQDLWEEFNKFKEVQSGLAKVVREIQERLDLEGSGGQSAPAEPTQLDMDTQSRKSSALRPKGHGTQPGMETGQGTPGSGSLEMQAGTQGEPVTPVKLSGTDHMRSCDGSASTSGMEPGSPGTQASTSGMEPGSPGTQISTLGMEPGSPGTQATTPLETQPGGPCTQATAPGMQSGSPGTQTSTPGMQPGSPGSHTTIPGGLAGTPGSHTTIPGGQAGLEGTQREAKSPRDGDTALPGAQLGQAGQPAVGTLSPTAMGFEIPPGADPRAASAPQEPAMPWGSSVSTSTSGHEAEMQETHSQVGQLGHLYAALKEEVEQLKEGKAERADLEKLRQLFPEGGRESITSILTNLQCQVSFLQDMARDLQREEEEEISKVEDDPRKMEVAGASREADGSGQMTQQLRPKGQKAKAEQKELEKEQELTQAELEQVAAEYITMLVTEAAEQLQAEPDESRETAQSGGQEQAGCLVCNSDMRGQLGKLLQRCKKLEEQVESLSQKVGDKVDSYPKLRRQSLLHDEVLKCVQGSIAQQQKDYEKFSSALANLQHDQQQEQKDIKALSQALGRLEKQKTDKEDLRLLGIDEKADKAALADEVRRSQFEASMGRLNKMMEEVTSRVTGQEKAWHQFQQHLQGEMDSKLDRRELGPFRQQLEERFKSLRGQLQEKALQPEHDNAAGIRKQLLAGFHCLSCDRPLDMLAPGPERTGECRYPTVPRSCGGPHTLTPPRFQPQLPSTPRQLPPITRAPNKAVMQLSGQNGLSEDTLLSGGGGHPLLAAAPAAAPTNRTAAPTSLVSRMLIQPPRSESTP